MGSTARSSRSPKISHRKLFHLLSDYLKSPQAARDLMRAFAGISITFPNCCDLEQLFTREEAFASLMADPSRETAKRLAVLHGLNVRDLVQGYRDRTGRGLRKAQSEAATASA